MHSPKIGQNLTTTKANRIATMDETLAKSRKIYFCSPIRSFAHLLFAADCLKNFTCEIVNYWNKKKNHSFGDVCPHCYFSRGNTLAFDATKHTKTNSRKTSTLKMANVIYEVLSMLDRVIATEETKRQENKLSKNHVEMTSLCLKTLFTRSSSLLHSFRARRCAGRFHFWHCFPSPIVHSSLEWNFVSLFFRHRQLARIFISCFCFAIFSFFIIVKCF